MSSVPQTPNLAPSTQPTLFRGLLSGALLGLAAGSEQVGPAANAAGNIGAGVRGVLGGEQQNFQNQVAQSGVQQRNVEIGQRQQQIQNEQQRIDIERSVALVQKMHLEALIQHMGTEDKLNTINTYKDQSKLYQDNGAYSMGEVDANDMAAWFQSHPETKPGDIHPVPVALDATGHPQRYEMLNVNKVMLPAGTPINVDGQNFKLSAPMPGSTYDSIKINEMVRVAEEKVAGQFKVQAAAVMGNYHQLVAQIQAGAHLTGIDLQTAEQAVHTFADGLTKLQVAGTNAQARNPILTSMGITPTGNPQADAQAVQSKLAEATQIYRQVQQSVQANPQNKPAQAPPVKKDLSSLPDAH